MVRKVTVQKPTEAELAILQILWDDGPTTVRHVHSILSERNKTGYTTVLKTMQIMFEKGQVVRNESARAHIYHAKLNREQIQGHLVNDLVKRAFGGSRSGLVMNLLGETSSTEELAEIRKLLDDLEGSQS